MFSTAALLTLSLALQTPPAPPSPPATPTTDRPITRFFQNLGTDLVHLPSIDTAVIASVGAGAALLASPVDDNLTTWTSGLGESGYTSVVGRRLGDGWFQGSTALIVYGSGLLSGHRLTTHVGSDLIRAQALNAVITRVFKLVAQRERPGGSHDSMPSGHASASFASATVLAEHFGWKAGVPAYAAASFVGWTRVRDRAHWLSDVVIGATVGTIAGRTVTAGHRGLQWTIVPTAGRNQVAVYVVRTGR